MRSANAGVSWTLVAEAETNQWSAVTFARGVFASVSVGGTHRAMRSPDLGISWTLDDAAEANQWTSVTFGNGRFVAVAKSGTNRVMYSEHANFGDGINGAVLIQW